MIKASEYNLPDQKVLNSEPNNELFVWQPDQTYLILGRSNSSLDSLNMDSAKKDNVKILKRPSGGETVLLSPNMLVVAVLIPQIEGFKPKAYFMAVNDIIMETLKIMGVMNLSTKGISDISIGEKKILGSAIYKKQGAYFYHAVLNIRENISLISKYIKHPTKEPDYRKGRSHIEFVTSLWKAGYPLPIEEIKNALKDSVLKL